MRDKMVQVRLDKKWKHMYSQGMHLENPTPKELEDAVGDAEAKGFKTIWVHWPRKEASKKTREELKRMEKAGVVEAFA